MKTYRVALKEAKNNLIKHQKSEQLGLLYLLELCNLYANDLYMQYDEEMSEELYQTYQQGIERLINHEPLQHILGYETFCGYRFEVSDKVLIPRPETEELVANVLGEIDEMFNDTNLTLIDVGTGSGAIAISLKKEEPNLTVYASDISADALEVAKRNAKNNDADVTFMQGDMLEPFIQAGIKVDVLVSNPPYIPSNEVLETTVVDFEPHVALFGGNDGLFFYRLIFERAHLLLKEKAILAFEMGWDQRETITALAKNYFTNADMEVLKDLNGNDRMFIIRLK